MRKIHTVLRLFHEAGLTQRAIARSQEIGRGTVSNYLTRAANAGLSWPLPPEMDERALEIALFPESDSDQALAQKKFTEPDYLAIHVDLKSAGMTKQLAWEEYRHGHGSHGYIATPSFVIVTALGLVGSVVR